MPSPKQKVLTFSCVALVLSVMTATFAVFHVEDGSNTVAFLLTDQFGQKTTHEDLSETSILVFFGFTSCDDVCPIGLHKLSNVIKDLKRTHQDDDITPVMITVDPERDTAERMKQYLANFSEKIVGLTGTRIALENTAAEFNTFLDKPPEHVAKTLGRDQHDGELHVNGHNEKAIIDHSTKSISNTHTTHLNGEHRSSGFIDRYQLRHSSGVYLVDTYSRVVDYISLDTNVESIANTLRRHLSTQG